MERFIHMHRRAQNGVQTELRDANHAACACAGGDETVQMMKDGTLVERLEAAGVTWEPEVGEQPSPEPEGKNAP